MITMHTLRGCDQCKTAKLILQKKGIKFREITHSFEIEREFPFFEENDEYYNYKEFLERYRK